MYTLFACTVVYVLYVNHNIMYVCMYTILHICIYVYCMYVHMRNISILHVCILRLVYFTVHITAPAGVLLEAF